MMVMVSTFASSGRAAMLATASPISAVSMVGSTASEQSACSTPLDIWRVMAVPALPISIWPQAMLNGRPSSADDLVRPVMACLVAV